MIKTKINNRFNNNKINTSHVAIYEENKERYVPVLSLKMKNYLKKIKSYYQFISSKYLPFNQDNTSQLKISKVDYDKIFDSNKRRKEKPLNKET